MPRRDFARAKRRRSPIEDPAGGAERDEDRDVIKRAADTGMLNF